MDEEQGSFWTGVGTRYPPREAFEQAVQVGCLMTRLGMHLRTGEAIGMDRGFTTGVDLVDAECKTVYTIKDQAWCDQRIGHVSSMQYENWDVAMSIAKSIHPNWAACERHGYARDLHTRNIFQVLGPELNEPSELLICWAIPKSGNAVAGGTNTAVTVAHDWGVPVFNLFEPETFDQLLEIYGRKGQ